jgi:hypothetical protein
MLRNSARSVLVLAVLAAAGCVSIPERDAVMEDARVSVDSARRNPQVASYALVELNQAVATLRQAEDLAARGGRLGEAAARDACKPTCGPRARSGANTK